MTRKAKVIIRRDKRKAFLGLEPIRLKLVQKNHSAQGIINPRVMEISHGSSGAQLICHLSYCLGVISKNFVKKLMGIDICGGVLG